MQIKTGGALLEKERKGIFMRILKDQNGNAILEFTLIFPLLIALFLGIINFAILLNNNIVAVSAAREAANVAAMTGNAGAAKARGEEILRIGLLNATGTVAANAPSGGNLRVGAQVDYNTAVSAPGFPVLVGQSPWSPHIALAEQTSHYVEYRHRNILTAPPRECVWCGCEPWGCP